MAANQPTVAVPSRSTQGGYVYLVQFDSGAIKVGRTQNPATRLKAHAASARAHGVKIAAQWVSQPIGNSRQNERRLIDLCNDKFVAVNDGEYFIEAQVSEILAYSETLQGDAGPLQMTECDVPELKNGRPPVGPKWEVRLDDETRGRVEALMGDRKRADVLRDLIVAGLDASEAA